MVNCWTTTVLTCASLVLYILANGCRQGWFGEECRYQCHCRQSGSCESNGECPGDGPCDLGFFGPGCQYTELLILKKKELTPRFLADDNDRTCNSDTQDTQTTLYLKEPHPFFWIRLILSNGSDNDTVTVVVNKNDKCENDQMFKIDLETIDIYCSPEGMLMQEITLIGNVVGRLCTVQISGGRNVAIKQTARQSSSATGMFLANADVMSQASNAVDGNFDDDYQQRSCSSTGPEPDGAEWFLDYNRPQIIKKVYIVNRSDTRDLLVGFTFETYSENATKIETYTEQSGNSDVETYDFVLQSNQPVFSIKIKGAQSQPSASLSLCEVMTFGETLCPENTYGLYCQQKCICLNDTTCNVVTGACSSGCQKTFYGHNCALRCSASCLNSECARYYGNCNSCPKGFTGKMCDAECPRGKYGMSCAMNCSVHCSNTCHYKQGYCVCKPPYQGYFCTDCPAGLFGYNCTQVCSSTCKPKTCDINNGKCFECESDRQGPYCQDCPNNFYGDNCDSACSEHCLNGTCDYKDGSCFDCTEGYSGRTCTYSVADDESSGMVYVLLLVVFLIIGITVFLVLGTILVRGRKTEARDQKSESATRVSTTEVTTTTSYTEV